MGIKKQRAQPRMRLPETAASTDDEHPSFSFPYMVDGFCLATCADQERSDFARALWNRSKMTWADLKKAPHRHLGAEKFPDQVKITWPPGVTEDVTFLVFRVKQAEESRMIGFRSESIFHVVWFDRDGNLYKHGN